MFSDWTNTYQICIRTPMLNRFTLLRNHPLSSRVQRKNCFEIPKLFRSPLYTEAMKMIIIIKIIIAKAF